MEASRYGLASLPGSSASHTELAASFPMQASI